MTRPFTSLCMIVRDEEEYLPQCLRSAAGDADEIIVVDTGSRDRTRDIARAFGARVLDREWTGDFAAARNYSLDQARGEWVIFLDADEELVGEDRGKLRPLLEAAGDIEGFYVNELSFVGDQPGIEAVSNLAFRIFRNRPAHRFVRPLHEQILPQVMRSGRIGFSELRLNHYGYLNRPAMAKDKFNRNLDILLKEAKESSGDSFTDFNLGVEYLRRREHELALQRFQRSFRSLKSLEQTYASILVKNIVLCLRILGRYDQAQKVLDDALEAYPEYTDLFFLRATVYHDAHDYDRAIEGFQRCLQMGEAPPRYFSEVGVGGYKAWLGLGLVYRDLEERSRASHAFTEALRSNRRYTPAIPLLVEQLVLASGGSKAQAVLDRFLEPAGPETLAEAARAFAVQRHPEVGLGYAQRARALDPQSPRLTFLHGALLLDLGRYAEALSTWAPIPGYSPWHLSGRLGSALAASLLGDLAAASHYLETAGENPEWEKRFTVYRAFVQRLGGQAPDWVRMSAVRRQELEEVVWDLAARLLKLNEFAAFEAALSLLAPLNLDLGR